jgi:hypothetical protein
MPGDTGNGSWVHVDGQPRDHNGCPYRVNPDNWK